MNNQIRIFADTFAVTRDREQSLKEAGYSIKNVNQSANRLLKREDVQEVLAEKSQKLSKRSLVTREIIEAGLLKVANGLLPRTGDEDFRSTPQSRTIAWKLLAEMNGMLRFNPDDPSPQEEGNVVFYIPENKRKILNIENEPEDNKASERVSRKILDL